MQAQEFDYEQFFAANDIGRVRPCSRAMRDPDDDGSDDFDDIPPPAWFRRESERDAFPPCRELLHWPTNYPVEADADLSDEGASEGEPNRFRYCDLELECWSEIVQQQVALLTAPPIQRVTSRPLPDKAEKRPAIRRASEVIEMAYGNQVPQQRQMNQRPVFPQQPEQQGEQRDPPVAKWSSGAITASMWSNPSPAGGTFNTVTIDRKYKTQNGWRSSRSLRLTDLPVAAALLQKAFGEVAVRTPMAPADGGESPPALAASIRAGAFAPHMDQEAVDATAYEG
jgi:hypothetical protein